jgi:hypothetical protein
MLQEQCMIEIKPMLPEQWQLHKAVRCAALAFYRSIGFDDTGKIKPELSTENRASIDCELTKLGELYVY